MIWLRSTLLLTTVGLLTSCTPTPVTTVTCETWPAHQPKPVACLQQDEEKKMAEQFYKPLPEYVPGGGAMPKYHW